MLNLAEAAFTKQLEAIVAKIAAAAKLGGADRDRAHIAINRIMFNAGVTAADIGVNVDGTAYVAPHIEEDVSDTGLIWSDDQRHVLDNIFTTLKARRTVSLTGPAGTGKTSLIREVCRRWKGAVALTAPTWCAAKRLQSVTGLCAGTPHAIAYQSAEFDEATDQLVFTSRSEGGYQMARGTLLVIDEAGMVDEKLLSDVRSAIPSDTYILGAGDPNQLPTISGRACGFELTRPDFELTTVHRQADSPHLDFCTYLRTHRTIITRRLVEDFGGVVIDADFDQIGLAASNGTLPSCIAARNQTVWSINCAAREQVFDAPLEDGPQVGERVMALNNNHAVGFNNGDIGVVRHCRMGYPVAGEETWFVLVEFDQGVRGMLVPHRSWLPASKPWDPQSRTRPINGLFKSASRKATYRLGALSPGYAITTHKAQGNEWDGGAVIMERAQWLGADEWRLAYTQTTRFKEWCNYINPAGVSQRTHMAYPRR